VTGSSAAVERRRHRRLASWAKSDHLTLAHGVTISALPPSMGKGGGEGHAAVPPILTFPRIGGRGSSDTPPERVPILRGAIKLRGDVHVHITRVCRSILRLNSCRLVYNRMLTWTALCLLRAGYIRHGAELRTSVRHV
jgi:hypothetical protein